MGRRERTFDGDALVVRTGERGRNGREIFGQALGMGQAPVLGLERRDARGIEILLLELLALVLEKIEATGAILFGGAQGLLLAIELGDARNLPGDDLAQVRRVRVGVESEDVGLGVAKRLGAVLTRDLELAAEHFAEGGDRHELAADPDTAAAARLQRSPDDQLGRLLGTVRRLGEQAAALEIAHDVLMAIHAKDRLDRPFGGSTAQRVGADSPTRKQRQRREHDRFTCAGLAGQDVQARAELELDRLDQRQVLDSKQLDHRRHPSDPNRAVCSRDDPPSQRPPARRGSPLG